MESNIYVSNYRQNFLKTTIKIIILILSFIYILYFIIILEYIKKNELNNLDVTGNYNKINQINLDYTNNKFAIITFRCQTCGLFAFYKHYLGCIVSYIIDGYIPIIDLISFKNIFNGLNSNLLIKNPWELFFDQPFGYTLENVKKKAKIIKYFKCKNNPISYEIFKKKNLLNFWHNIAIKYLPIKNEFILLANKIKKKLFKNSNNILGILARGTDYISLRPLGHPKPPHFKMMFKDIKKMNKKNKYDWLFITTEDDIILSKFINEFRYKLKYIKKNIHIKYNYLKKRHLCYNNNIKGNLKYIKNYLINIIILSKCIDVIIARTSGSICMLIFKEKFRNSKVYYIGKYKGVIKKQ